MNSVTETRFGLYVGGEWTATDETEKVYNKYTQSLVGETAVASEEHVIRAVGAGKEALRVPFSPYERYEVLSKVAKLLRERNEEFATTIADEVGKPIAEARGEVGRAALTLEISAEEAKRIHGEGIPVESAPGSENRHSFTKRYPVGVVAAITPFNVPLNLVCHKIGPAIAAGNSVVLKPDEKTPLCALLLTELFEQAGLPKGRLNVLTGKGDVVGPLLTANEEIDMYTFTGSPRVGQLIREQVGLRKVALELGNNSATIVHNDADVEEAAKQVAQKSFNNAGQVCISVQRVYVHRDVYSSFVDKVKAYTKEIKLGDPRDPSTNMGPMIAESEAERVEAWVKEAVEQGATVETGGKREGVFYHPTVLTNVHDDMKVCRQEVFGPVVAIAPYETEEEVIAKVNDSEYGLQAGLFTNNLAFAMKAMEEIEVGGLIVNDTSGYRVDHMPYGGVKKSGHGKEGPRYAIEEMTEEKIVVFNL
ncbi:aldehyde dehydrogenase [Pontibacillus halophilus JSM 076056 = DSM 19796]|uniref:3-sulfolactaldehyde dehydrogenase n=1 Tax=Pontibacillus halophilus JSM 076056 = DSM 19796 TaxID=1385510 RepID=A0A0A5GGH3_9BACI|nr:aldehyde dehydrogenase family protein [Pontibacillus halophilus]KGX92346.1 aldehyde dehydrogenase [Pontibacillus halophilus JSM 076056 = DSM 19796]